MSFAIGDYTAHRQLAVSENAGVWAGEHTRTGRAVALKIMSALSSEQIRREAALAAFIEHPHLVSAYDVAVGDEWCALVLEPANGGSLANLLADRKLTDGQTITLLAGIGAALAVAHERGLTHGDLSPGNILLDDNSKPMLADLGAARAAAEINIQVSATPGYVAPEVARGAVPNAASDVFSLGAVALHCLTGKPAWPADDLRDVVIQATAGQWPDPGTGTGASPKLLRLLRSMLNADPTARPGAATVLLDLQTAGTPQALSLGGASRSTEDATVRDSSESSGRHACIDSEQAGGEQIESELFGAGPAPAESDSADPDSAGSQSAESLDARMARFFADADESGLEFGVRAVRPVSSVSENRASTIPERSDLRRPRHGGGREIAGAGSANAVGANMVGANTVGANTVGATTEGTPTRPTFSTGSDRSGVRTQIRARAQVAEESPAPRGRIFASRRTVIRFVVLPVVVTMLLAGAVFGGLWWAQTTESQPLSISGATETVSGGPLPVLSESETPGSVSVSTTADAVTTALPSSAATDDAQWQQVITDLDRLRSAAFAALDVQALLLVYPADSVALKTDADRIVDLQQRGLRVDGVEHQIHQVIRLDRPGIVIQVTDTMPATAIRDEAGVIVARTTERPSSTRTVELVEVGSEFRIVSVTAD